MANVTLPTQPISSVTPLSEKAPPRSRRPAIAGTLLVLAFLPLLVLHAQWLWGRPHYQFFPLILVGVGLLAYRALAEGGDLQPGSRRSTLILFGLSWASLGVAVFLNSGWLGAVAALLTWLAVAQACGGIALVRALLPAWILALLMVPPPLNLDLRLVQLLQTIVSRASSRVLDQLGVFHNLAGNVVEIGSRRFLVEEACSGIHSLTVVLAFTLFFVFWVRRPIWHGILLLGSAVAWVLLENTLRVLSIVYLAMRSSIDVSEGWRHDLLGILLFSLTLCLLASTDRLLLFFTPVRDKRQLAPEGKPAPFWRAIAWPAAQSTLLASWPVAAFYGFLVLAEGYLLASQVLSPGPAAPVPALADIKAETLPASLGAWKQMSFETEHHEGGSVLGEHVHIWRYQGKTRRATAILAYPFVGWHDVTYCYRLRGRQVFDERSRRLIDDDASAAPDTVEAHMSKQRDVNAYLLYQYVDRTGQPLTPPEQEPPLVAWLHARLEIWKPSWGERPRGLDSEKACWQLQLLVEGWEPFQSAEETDARALFAQLKEHLLVRGSKLAPEHEHPSQPRP